MSCAKKLDLSSGFAGIIEKASLRWVMTIYFYKVEGPYGCFSNFSPHPIEIGGKQWPTSEHYYQAQKFVGTLDEDLCEEIRHAVTPERAAALGRDCHRTVRTDWEQVKCSIMYAAVFAKFLTHVEIQKTLLETGTEPIVENSPTDYFWGCGQTRTGSNHLGKILMQVRDKLQGVHG